MLRFLTDHLSLLLAVVVPAVHLLGILTAFRAVMDVRTSQGAVAWAVSLVTFPYLAVPLYWVFGRNTFNGYVEALRIRRLEHREEIEQVLENIRAHRASLDTDRDRDICVLERLAPLPCTRGNKATLLEDGESTFSAIFEAIDSARSYVIVQFFIIHDDQLGGELREHLTRKSNEGVRIYVLYDEIGSRDLPISYVEELRTAGVLVHGFKTTRGPRNRFQLNFRNHRKIVVVDGHVAFVGGLNVGDEYMGRSKRFGHWRDTHLRIEGPAVQCAQVAFMTDWYWATRATPQLNWQPRLAAGSDQNLLVLPTGPADELDACTMFFLQVIHSARRRLWIASPYFVPNSAVLSSLKLAALRGVDVRIMLPSKADHILVYLAAFAYLSEAESANIKVLRYRPGFLHEKVILVDDRLASVGTANLDNRSMRLNFEITILVSDRAFVRQVEAMLERDFSNCREVTADEYYKRGFLFRVAVRSSRLLSPIL